MVFVCDVDSYCELFCQFYDCEIEKVYIVFCWGLLELDSGCIELLLCYDLLIKLCYVVDFEYGCYVLIFWCVIECYECWSRVELMLIIGCLYQLCVYMFFIGYLLFGDCFYVNFEVFVVYECLCLYVSLLCLIYLQSGECLCFELLVLF